MTSAEQLVAQEVCPRRRAWSEQYEGFRVSLTGALYTAMRAGLTTAADPEKTAEDALLALAARPGLAVEGPEIYSIAMSYAKLAAILAVALRSGGAPWALCPATDTWVSGCYNAGDGVPRRLVLVDRWSKDREAQESTNWRTVGELVALETPILITLVEIGTTRGGRRISPWTRAYRHPKNNTCRFRKLHGPDTFAGWNPVWREDCELKTKDWLDLMTKDGCMDAIQTRRVGLPARPERYLTQIESMKVEMDRPGLPPMRLAGCHDRASGECPFLVVCHGPKEEDPARYGFRLRGSALGACSQRK